MATKQQDKKLENLVEQKVLEFLGDPDSGLALKKNLLAKLRKNMAQKNRRFTPHASVLKRYGVR